MNNVSNRVMRASLAGVLFALVPSLQSLSAQDVGFRGPSLAGACRERSACLPLVSRFSSQFEEPQCGRSDCYPRSYLRNRFVG